MVRAIHPVFWGIHTRSTRHNMHMHMHVHMPMTSCGGVTHTNAHQRPLRPHPPEAPSTNLHPGDTRGGNLHPKDVKVMIVAATISHEEAKVSPNAAELRGMVRKAGRKRKVTFEGAATTQVAEAQVEAEEDDMPGRGQATQEGMQEAERKEQKRKVEVEKVVHAVQSLAEVREVLGNSTDFVRRKAAGAGDCFFLAALAGAGNKITDNEIPARAALYPCARTMEKVMKLRKRCVALLAGDEKISGIPASTLRRNEGLPQSSRAAGACLQGFLRNGFWAEVDHKGRCTNGGLFATMVFATAVTLGRPIIVLERIGGNMRTPIKVYGARSKGCLRLTNPRRKPQMGTLAAFILHNFEEVLEMMRQAHHTPCSVMEWNGSDHFDPWVMARTASGEESGEQESGEGEGEEEEEEEDCDDDGDDDAEEEEE